MRVLAFHGYDMRPGSGSAIRSRLLVTGLAKQGADVCVVARGVPEDLGSSGILGRSFATGESPHRILWDTGKRFRPDVIYAFTDGKAPEVLWAGKRLGCAMVCDLHGFAPVEVIDLARRGSPVIPQLRESVRRLRAIRRFDGLTVANPTLLPIARFLNARCRLVAGAADLAHFSPRGETRALGSPDRIQVVYAGNFYRWQGCELLLNAAGILLRMGEPFDFTLIGSGGLDDGLRRRWESPVHGGAIRFLGAVDYSEIPVYLRSADILVIPRPLLLSTHLAFPNKISDYMATGRAVLATDLAPHRYAFRDGQTGVICRRSAAGLVEGFLRLKSREFRERLGRMARRHAEQHFCAFRSARAVFDFLDDVLRQRSSR